MAARCTPETCTTHEQAHGKLSGYFYHRCRCAECVEWNRVFRQGRRALARAAEPKTHGTATGYGDHGCRCAECCAWYRASHTENRPSVTQGHPMTARTAEWWFETAVPEFVSKYERQTQLRHLKAGAVLLREIQTVVTQQERTRKWQKDDRVRQQKHLQSGRALLRELRQILSREVPQSRQRAYRPASSSRA